MTRAKQAARKHDRRATSDAGGLTPTTVRVAIYLRISTDEEHQPFSLEAQEHRLTAFVPTQPGWVHVETYKDQISGAKADRPELNRALLDARLGRYDVLLVYRVDRFARSLKVLVDLLGALDSCGVAFRSATEPIDTSTATGRMLVQLLGVFAEFERATIIDRVVNGMERRAVRGSFPGGRIPFGLALDDAGRLIIGDRGDFAVVERVFARYATGTVGAAAICGELEADGVRNRNGRPWTTQAMLNLLRNRAYVGEVNWQGTWYRSADPFIDPLTFDRVQALVDERGEDYEKRFTARRPEYLLTSLVKCGKCSRNFIGVASHGRSYRYRYYMCWTRNRYGPNACDADRIRAEELEDKVFDALLKVYSDAEVLREAVAEDAAEQRADQQRRLDALAGIDAELRKAERATERYMQAFEDGKLSPELFGERVDQLARETQRLRSRRAELDVPATLTAAVLTDEAVRAIHADLHSTAHDAPESVKKAVAQAFVHELRVEDRRTVRPRFYVLPELPTNPNADGAAPLPYSGACNDKQSGR